MAFVGVPLTAQLGGGAEWNAGGSKLARTLSIALSLIMNGTPCMNGFRTLSWELLEEGKDDQADQIKCVCLSGARNLLWAEPEKRLDVDT